jgi:hypothetical protein
MLQRDQRHDVDCRCLNMAGNPMKCLPRKMLAEAILRIAFGESGWMRMRGLRVAGESEDVL